MHAREKVDSNKLHTSHQLLNPQYSLTFSPLTFLLYMETGFTSSDDHARANALKCQNLSLAHPFIQP